MGIMNIDDEIISEHSNSYNTHQLPEMKQQSGEMWRAEQD